MDTRMVFFVLAISAGLPAFAGRYDGLYRPDADWASGWDCRTVGADGGALEVRDGRFFGLENTCDLTNPVEVRDLPATLYDAECQGEGMTDRYRMMLMSTPEGLVVVREGFVDTLIRCD